MTSFVNLMKAFPDINYQVSNRSIKLKVCLYEFTHPSYVISLTYYPRFIGENITRQEWAHASEPTF